MIAGAVEIRSMDGALAGAPPIAALLAAEEPVLLRGLARDWSLVQAGLNSAEDALAELRDCYNGRPVQYSYGAPDIRGRPFYTSDFMGLNCEVRRGDLREVLDAIAAGFDSPETEMYYVASLPVDACLPGLRARNGIDFAGQEIDAPPSIWIGNRVVASCHYDAPNNLACCAVGRRRFTLFPPDQIGNLYPGPLDPTPGGQAVSVIDFHNPDLERYPRFRKAMAVARSVVLEPGDALFIPSMWWHHVEALESFNVLVNYWWASHPAWMPTPMHALYHALWTLRDRPEQEKRAWREVFDYYVFGPADQAGDHLPPVARQVLGPIDEALARQLRAMLIGKLNR